MQIRSHAQKYFQKIIKKGGTQAAIPPARPKRKANDTEQQQVSLNSQRMNGCSLSQAGSLFSTAGGSHSTATIVNMPAFDASTFEAPFLAPSTISAPQPKRSAFSSAPTYTSSDRAASTGGALPLSDWLHDEHQGLQELQYPWAPLQASTQEPRQAPQMLAPATSRHQPLSLQQPWLMPQPVQLPRVQQQGAEAFSPSGIMPLVGQQHYQPPQQQQQPPLRASGFDNQGMPGAAATAAPAEHLLLAGNDFPSPAGPSQVSSCTSVVSSVKHSVFNTAVQSVHLQAVT